MSLYLSFSIFLCLMILLCQATPILTPQEHAQLQGDKFCDRGNKILKKICVKAAKDGHITGYRKSALENLSCKKGDAGKVLLDPGDGGEWELVQDALLECIFEMPADQLMPLPYAITKTFGRGRNEFDAFEYTWNREKSRYVVGGLYRDLLEGLIK